MSSYRSHVISTGRYLPEKIMTNYDLANIVDTSHEWIVRRTGIHQRYIAADHQTTSDLAVHAARNAIDNAAGHADDIDLVIVATSSPEKTFPATATHVQYELGINQGAAFDVQAVCAGFVFALSIADHMIRLGTVKSALVIGAELYSRIIDWTDRSTCVLFSDGAGAVVLKASEENADDRRGILGTKIWSDGKFKDALYTDGGPGSSGSSGKIKMKGKEVYRQAVVKMSDAVIDICKEHHIPLEDISWLVAHQANERILDVIGERLGIDPKKIIKTVRDYANNSAATIPIALSVSNDDKKFKKGDLIALSALGAGFSWGSALIRW